MKTKKILLVLTALVLICPVMHGQKSVDELFNKFSKEKGTTHVNVGKITMTFASLFTDVMGVTGVEVWSFDECEQSVKDKITKAIASLKDEKYEPLVTVNDSKEHTKILIRVEDETIRELIILTTGDDPAMVRIKGKIKPSDLEKVMKNNNPSKEK
jgi:hypothetical protein